MDAVSVGLGVGFYLFKCEASTYFIESQKNLSLEDLWRPSSANLHPKHSQLWSYTKLLRVLSSWALNTPGMVAAQPPRQTAPVSVHLHS